MSGLGRCNLPLIFRHEIQSRAKGLETLDNNKKGGTKNGSVVNAHHQAVQKIISIFAYAYKK